MPQARMTGTQRLKMYAALDEVVAERARQHARWGEIDHPDGTGHYDPTDDGSGHAAAWHDGTRRESERDQARAECDAALADGTITYRHILAEEVTEAFAEHGSAKLRAELVQVAATAIEWIEAIDRRPK